MNRFLIDTGVEHPIIGGPMYPCSNPELVAAISEAGGIGIIQPISLTYVYGYDLKEGIQYIRSLTDKPIGMNVLIETNSLHYRQLMKEWIDIALDEGVMFFITSLGKPDWVVDQVHPRGAKVYHDVTEARWARIAVQSKVDGLVCVNALAGGHAGRVEAKELYDQLEGMNLPLVCAGGVGDNIVFQEMLLMGYEAVQMGTRFIASKECKAPLKYKEEIVRAHKEDIVRSLNLTGVEVSVINTAYVQRLGLRPNRLLFWMLTKPVLKRIVRFVYVLRSLKNLKGLMKGDVTQEGFYQAGKSVEGIHSIESVQTIINELVEEV